MQRTCVYHLNSEDRVQFSSISNHSCLIIFGYYMVFARSPHTQHILFVLQADINLWHRNISIYIAQHTICKNIKSLQHEINSHFASSLSLAAASLLSFAACAKVDGLRGQRSDTYALSLRNTDIHKHTKKHDTFAVISFSSDFYSCYFSLSSSYPLDFYISISHTYTRGRAFLHV